MPKLTRAQAIQLITIHAAEGNRGAALTVYVEHRIGRETYNRAYQRGLDIGRKIAAGMTPYDAMRTTK